MDELAAFDFEEFSSSPDYIEEIKQSPKVIVKQEQLAGDIIMPECVQAEVNAQVKDEVKEGKR